LLFVIIYVGLVTWRKPESF